MALQKNLFQFTGKLGNVVGYSHNGKYCLRSAPVRKNKSLSTAQMAHQRKFAFSQKFVASLTPLLSLSMTGNKKITYSNFVMSHTMKNALYGSYPDYHINYSLVRVCHGHLQPAWKEKVTAASQNIIFSWENNSGHGNAKEDDNSVLVVYCEALNQCIYSINGAERRYCAAVFPVAQFQGQRVQTWMAFRSATGKLISHSTYTGALFIT
ncbi:DUF6266 family protein [Longitalea luteola]|uniref:DUF6266 family protein n=1 Tax=Longitalea luteola TaxID=2812563 RepID=UPI001A960B82|nr:DUF6266 family protein [Longitalea luteola]